MSIEIWDWGLGYIYLWDVLIAWKENKTLSYDFTKWDYWFTVNSNSSSNVTYWRGSNWFYCKSTQSYAGVMLLDIPQTLKTKWTPKKIELYFTNWSINAWVWFSYNNTSWWWDSARVFNKQIQIYWTLSWTWSTITKSVSPNNQDICVLDFENNLLYLQSSSSTTWALSDTPETMWSNWTFAIQLATPNNSTYCYLTKAIFYF